MSERDQPFSPSDLYRDYSAHKQWAGNEPVDDFDRFSWVMRKVKLAPRSTILEVGFGEGRFLDWARKRGHTVVGVEILPEMVASARARGHVAHLGDVSQLETQGRRFDLLAAFDVIEHLTIPEIRNLLQCADRLLNVGGRIVLQFPNASSPFSGYYQSGDLTHQLALSRNALQQLSRTMGWMVTQCFNARNTSTHPLKQIKMSIAHILRDCVEIVFGFVYYGTRRPLDPNIIVVLARR